MRRSGALTLGVVLTLGGVTGGRGQELSGSLAAVNAPLAGCVCSADAPAELGRFAVHADGFPNRGLQL